MKASSKPLLRMSSYRCKKSWAKSVRSSLNCVKKGVSINEARAAAARSQLKATPSNNYQPKSWPQNSSPSTRLTTYRWLRLLLKMKRRSQLSKLILRILRFWIATELRRWKTIRTSLCKILSPHSAKMKLRMNIPALLISGTACRWAKTSPRRMVPWATWWTKQKRTQTRAI